MRIYIYIIQHSNPIKKALGEHAYKVRTQKSPDTHT